MRRFFPRDVLLVARLLAVAGALVWISIGGQATLPVAYVALGFIVATSVLVWLEDVRRHGVRSRFRRRRPLPSSGTCSRRRCG